MKQADIARLLPDFTDAVAEARRRDMLVWADHASLSLGIEMSNERWMLWVTEEGKWKCRSGSTPLADSVVFAEPAALPQAFRESREMGRHVLDALEALGRTTAAVSASAESQT